MNGFEKVCFHLEDYDNPHGMKMEWISNVFLDTLPKISNVRYFNAQQTALDHVVDWDIDMTLQDNDKVGLEGDARDSALWGLQQRWL